MTPAEKLASLVQLRRSQVVTPKERIALTEAIEAYATALGLPVPKDPEA